MTINSHLTARASAAVLSASEKSSIQTSIITLSSRCSSYFGTTVSNKFVFGSYARGTILPRSMDARSDVDYMVVFAEGGYQPQTYLDRLRRFVEEKYSRSEIYQSSPTIVLELNHIKFELVPALSGTVGYRIPDGSGYWQDTYPHGAAALLEDKNKSELYRIKPSIRLLKYWNALNGYPYASYALETRAVSESYGICVSQQDYFCKMVNDLWPYGGTQHRQQKVERAQKLVREALQLERDGYPNLAEAEMKKLIP